jgi:hypothetical protein
MATVSKETDRADLHNTFTTSISCPRPFWPIFLIPIFAIASHSLGYEDRNI